MPEALKNPRRLFVLDTNVLMHDPTAIFRFQEHDIFLPMVVLEELDAGKKGLSEVARNVRQVSRFLDELIGNRTNETSMVQFLEKDSHLENILEEFAASLTPSILDELRAENEFSRLDRRAADKRARLEGRNLSNVPLGLRRL